MDDKKVDEYVQPGGERYLKWARDRLAALDRLREDINIPAMSKQFKFPDGALIRITAGEFVNRIRIFAGGGWDFYGTAVDLDTLTGYLFTGVHGKALTVMPVNGTIGWTYATSSFGKSFGLIVDDGARKFVDPKRKVAAVHDGAYDSYTPSVTISMAANAKEQAFVASNDFTATNSVISPTLSLSTDLVPSLTTVYPTIADPAPGEGQEYTPAEPNFYVFDNHPGGVEPDLRMWGLNEQTLVQSQTNPGDWTVWSAGSLYDAMFTRPDADALNIEYYSARVGFVATRTRYDYGGFGVISEGAMVPLANTFVFFDVERQEQDFGDINADGDPNVNIRIGVTKLTGEFGVSGLAYDSLKAEYNFKAGFGAGSPEHFRLVGAVATRTVAYAFFLYNTYNDTTGNAYTLRCIGSDGSDAVVDTAFPLDTLSFGTSVLRQEFVVGSTIDTPYLACMDRASGGPRKVRIYNSTGLVHETAASFQAWAADGKNTLFTNGNTRDHMFFIVKGATGAQVHSLREDGETFEVNAILGGRTFTTPGGASVHNVNAITDRNLIYNFVGSPVCHFTNKQGDPLAPVVKEYALPYASYAASVSVPVRSGIMKLQEFEAWA